MRKLDENEIVLFQGKVIKVDILFQVFNSFKNLKQRGDGYQTIILAILTQVSLERANSYYRKNHGVKGNIWRTIKTKSFQKHLSIALKKPTPEHVLIKFSSFQSFLFETLLNRINQPKPTQSSLQYKSETKYTIAELHEIHDSKMQLLNLLQGELVDIENRIAAKYQERAKYIKRYKLK
jgi:hypothetical protein